FNAGLAVDSQGNAYVTGVNAGGYPYTVTPPALPRQPSDFRTFLGLPFLSKLDPAGQHISFSVPVGGAGVNVDSAGALYVAGRVGAGTGGSGIVSTLPALASVPAACLPDSSGELPVLSSAYVSQADPITGAILGTEFIGGANVNPSAIALAGSTVWITGQT